MLTFVSMTVIVFFISSIYFSLHQCVQSSTFLFTVSVKDLGLFLKGCEKVDFVSLPLLTEDVFFNFTITVLPPTDR